MKIALFARAGELGMPNDLKRFSWSFTFGALIVAAGVVLLLDQQGLINADRVFNYFWPAVFILGGAAMLTDCRGKGGRGVTGLIFVTIGFVLLLENLGIARVRFDTLWPIIVIGVGLLMIFRAIGPPAEGSPARGWWDYLRVGGSDNGAEFNHVAVFSGFKRRTTSKSFKGGKILAVFGGFTIDLRQADIDGESAAIEAISFMGGGEIRVPYTWNVAMEGIGFMGGYVDETDQSPPPPGTPRKQLIVKGAAIMGGIVVKN
jgi:LiaF transmembrane domain